jgi:hypothetical protein
MAVLSLSMWTMYRDGNRFPRVRWVVLITCGPCPFRCCSMNHAFQLCNRHPIHDRRDCVWYDGHIKHRDNQHAASTL